VRGLFAMRPELATIAQQLQAKSRAGNSLSWKGKV